jgi:predicted acetyltransferase
LDIRPVGPDDDLTQELDLRVRSFGPIPSAHYDQLVASMHACVAAGSLIGAFDQTGRLIGSARYLDLRQWWHGRDLPMAGVAGVKVAPEARGRGVGRTLMTEVLTAVAERGYPISVLYPATPPVYRSLGWEFAGGFYRTEIACRALTSLLPPDPSSGSPAGVTGLRRAGPEDAEEVIAVMDAAYAASLACGPTAFGVDDVRRDLAEEDEFGYLAADGFVSYGFDDGTRAIEVSYLTVGSAATAAAIWGILGSHSTVTRTIGAYVSPSDPIGWMLRDEDIEVRLVERSMLRVVDPVAAIAGRGFPVGAQVSADLRLVDAALPANSGAYRLTVADGTGSLVKTAAGPDAGGPLTLGARGFAALFAGTPVSTLRVAGLASGGDARSGALIDSAFACRPFMIDSF